MGEDDDRVNKITETIIGAAIDVHRALGPGLLESAYEACLFSELRSLGIKVNHQVPMPVVYRDVKLDCGYRVDMLVDDQVIVEIKAVETVLPVHEAQLLSYLKLSGLKTGLLINFNVKLLKKGIQRITNFS